MCSGSSIFEAALDAMAVEEPHLHALLARDAIVVGAHEAPPRWRIGLEVLDAEPVEEHDRVILLAQQRDHTLRGVEQARCSVSGPGRSCARSATNTEPRSASPPSWTMRTGYRQLVDVARHEAPSLHPRIMATDCRALSATDRSGVERVPHGVLASGAKRAAVADNSKAARAQQLRVMEVAQASDRGTREIRWRASTRFSSW